MKTVKPIIGTDQITMSSTSRQPHMTKYSRFLFAALLVLVMVMMFTTVPIQAQTPTPTPIPSGPTLLTLRSRNQLVCGVNQDLVGLGYLDPNSGDIVGMQVDLCRALAVALFGDSAAVQFPPYASADAAMKALQSGEADLLMRDT